MPILVPFSQASRQVSLPPGHAALDTCILQRCAVIRTSTAEPMEASIKIASFEARVITLESDQSSSSKGEAMDKDRIKGSVRQAKGALKEVAGKVTGDAKLEAEGKSDKIAGKAQNAVGGLKDTLRGK